MIELSDSEKDLETGLKVVSIMQTITEELDEEGKRMLRKILGIRQPDRKSSEDGHKEKSDE